MFIPLVSYKLARARVAQWVR